MKAQEPERGKYIFLGIVTSEVLYQGTYCITQDHTKSQLVSFFGTMAISLTRAYIDKSNTGEFPSCEFATMGLVGNGVVAIGHGIANDYGKNWTLYDLKIKFETKTGKIKFSL